MRDIRLSSNKQRINKQIQSNVIQKTSENLCFYIYTKTHMLL